MLRQKGPSGFFKYVLHLIEISHAEEIMRRLFVMNAFDGLLTMFGIVLGAFMAGVQKPDLILVVGLTTAVAMFSSGAWGAYLTEAAERRRELHELERQMLTRLDKTEIGKASRVAIALTALVDGSSPVLAAAFLSLPFILSKAGFFSMEEAYLASFAFSLVGFFALGVFLSKISREKWWAMGLRMVFAGLFSGLLGFTLASVAERLLA